MCKPNIPIKSIFVEALSKVSSFEPFKGNVLYFLTPSGFVTGTVLSLEDFISWRKDNDSRLFNAVIQPLEDQLADIPGGEHDRASYVCLKDVKDHLTGKCISLPYFVLFLDQLIGVYTAPPQSV